MAAPFGVLELPKKNEVSGDFLPKHFVLMKSTKMVLSVCQLRLRFFERGVERKISVGSKALLIRL